MKRNFKRLISIVLILVTILSLMTMFASATDIKTGIGTVMSNGLRLRKSKSTNSAVIATAGKGDKVIVLADYGDWLFVNYNLDVGYMAAGYLNVSKKADVNLGVGKLNCNAKFRSGPSTGDSCIEQLKTGALVEIIGFNNKWYKVKYQGEKGYIRSDLVDLQQAPSCNSGSSAVNKALGVADLKADSSSKKEESKKEESKSSKDSSSKSGSKSSSSKSTSKSKSAKSSSKSSSSAKSANSYTDSAASSKALKTVEFAKTLLGIRYKWGGTTTKGFDCSGFTWYVFKNMGKKINRCATPQLKNGTKVDRDELAPGDIVFFHGTYSTSSAASHCGIYVGDGMFIHASSGKGKVVISDLNSDYYSSHYYSARRIFD